MPLMDDGTGFKNSPTLVAEQSASEKTMCISTAVAVLDSIVEVACEHERNLDLMRLANFIDLYRTHLEDLAQDANKGVNPVGFEQFLGSSDLLMHASSEATKQSGEKVAVPMPLMMSANEPMIRLV